MNRTQFIFIFFAILSGGFLVYLFLWPQDSPQTEPLEQSNYQPLEGERVITVLYTGNTQSYLEPCGCYPGQAGGIARRATLIDQIRKQEKSVLLVDAGGIFEGTNSLDRLRAKANMEAMEAIGYDAILLSSTELQFGDRFLGEIATELQLPFVSTNDPPLWQNGEFVQPVFTKKLSELNEKYKTVSKTSRDQWLEREIHWVYPDFDIVQSYVDLRSVLKTSTMACYALSYARLPVSIKAQMRLGVSGALKVWLNDELVYLNPNQKYGLRVDEYIVPVALKSGLNKILVKVVQRGEKVTGFYLRLTDENGKPLDNVEVVLSPEATLLPKKHSMLWRVYSHKPK